MVLHMVRQTHLISSHNLRRSRDSRWAGTQTPSSQFGHPGSDVSASCPSWGQRRFQGNFSQSPSGEVEEVQSPTNVQRASMVFARFLLSTGSGTQVEGCMFSYSALLFNHAPSIIQKAAQALRHNITETRAPGKPNLEETRARQRRSLPNCHYSSDLCTE